MGFGLFKMTRDACLLNTERSRYTWKMCKSKVKLSLLGWKEEETGGGDQRDARRGKNKRIGNFVEDRVRRRIDCIENFFEDKVR